MTAARCNGITIEYEAIGDSAAPAILLIMGLGMQLVAWPEPFCRDLAARGFRLIRFDNRDCGLSARITTRRKPRLGLAAAMAWLGLALRAPYTLNDMAADAVGLLDALGVARAHVVGASLGGMVAQLVAARHPGRVLSLTSIMSSSGNRRAGRPKPAALRALLSRPPDGRDVAAVVDHLLRVFGIIGSPAYPPAGPGLRRRVEAAVRRAYDPAGTARQLIAVIASGDRRAELARIVAPTLVIHGAEDPLVPLEAGRDTADHIRGARLMVVPGMGHDLPEALLPALAAAIAAHCHEAAGASGAPGPT